MAKLPTNLPNPLLHQQKPAVADAVWGQISYFKLKLLWVAGRFGIEKKSAGYSCGYPATSIIYILNFNQKNYIQKI